MSPSSLRSFANTTQAQQVLVGFEAELVVPMPGAHDEGEWEPDYSYDTSADSIRDVIRFFSQGDLGLSRPAADRLRYRMEDDFQEWLDQQATQRAGEQLHKRIRDLATRDGMSEDEIQELLDDHTRAYMDYEQQALEEIQQEVYEELGQSEWLYDVGLHDMSNIAEVYNLDWPYMTQTTSEQADQIHEVAHNLESDLGIKVYSSGTYHGAPRVADAWVLEPDSTIRVNDSSSEAGLELITPSPPFPLPEALIWIDRVFGWATNYGCYTNKSTGFHMSVSLPNHTSQDIDWLKLVLMLGDQHVLSVFGRGANTYAQSALEEFRKYMAASDKFPMVSALDAMRKGMIKLASNALGKPFMNKYVTVNVKPDFIEFRSAGGNYLENKQAIETTMIRYVRALVLAADPEAEKREYATKLYKLLTRYQTNTKQNWALELFSLYNAGSIDKTVLINSLRSHRQNLKQKDQ